jgi:hypothetical protein
VAIIAIALFWLINDWLLPFAFVAAIKDDDIEGKTKDIIIPIIPKKNIKALLFIFYPLIKRNI